MPTGPCYGRANPRIRQAPAEYEGNSLEREEDRQDSEIVSKAVELKHIKVETAKLFLDLVVTEDSAYNSILKQLRHWQDKDVMSTYSKQCLKEIPKGTGFHTQDSTESLYRFLETTARNNVLAGFLLNFLRPVCASEEEHQIAVVMREACTRVWQEQLCEYVVTSLEKRMPQDIHAFTQAQ
jgi:hypothetical protein